MVTITAFLMGLGLLEWRAATSAVRAARPAAPLAVGSLGAVTALCVHGITDAVTYYARAHLSAWALLGIAMGVAMVCSRARDR